MGRGQRHLASGGGTLPVAGGGGAGDYLPLSGGTLTGPLTLASNPTLPMHAAPKQYVDTFLPLAGGVMTGLLTLSGAPTSNLHAATKLYVDGRTPTVYASATKLATPRTIDLTGDVTATAVAFDGTANIALATTVGNDTHTHNTQYFTEAEVNSLLAGKANTHSHPYLNTGGGTVSGDVTFQSQIYVADARLNVIMPNAEWPYGGASNGSLRYLGLGNWIYQNNGSSSVEEKVYVQPVDFSKSIFSRLTPIWFHYSKNHTYKALWNPEVWKREINPEGIGRMGFTYEQMIEEAPHWTYKTDEGMECIGYDAMIPDFMAWATAAIQSLLAEREVAA